MLRGAPAEALRRVCAASRGIRAAPPIAPALSVLLCVAAAPSCVRPPQMCIAEADCRTDSSCVAGRCIGHGAVPAIATARRILVSPVDMAYLRRGDGSNEAVAIASLGSGDGALLFLRFALRLPPETSVLEAYLLLERATEVDDDPTPLALHVAPIAEPWDSAAVSWARQPRVDEVGAPVTRVRPGSGPLVRLDVRDIVESWRRRARDEFGLAVVAEGKSVTGISVALGPSLDAVRPGSRVDPALPDGEGQTPTALAESPASTGQAPERAAALAGPRLELYVE